MTEEVARFVERFASVLVEAGMPRMPARVFVALLATDSGRLTAAELAELLQVSPAAVSGAVRYLAQVSLVDPRARARLAARRLPRSQDDLWYEAIVRREQLLTRWQRALGEGVDGARRRNARPARGGRDRRVFAFLSRRCRRCSSAGASIAVRDRQHASARSA